MNDQITIDPTSTAVLLLHFQFATLSAGEALPLADDAAAFVDRLRTVGATIGFVNLGFEESDAAAVPASNPMLVPIAAAGMMRVGSPEAANPPSLTPQEGDIVVRNTRFGAFSTSPIEAELSSRGIRTLVLAGVATGAAVLTTALEASDRDYEVIVASDLVADPDPSVQSAVLNGIVPRIGRAASSASIAA